MSAAAEYEQEDYVVRLGDAVELDRVEGETQVGVVRERHRYDGFPDAPDRFDVEIEGGQLVNIGADRVEVVVGAEADLIHEVIDG